MKPSEIRAELLGQHAELRANIKAIRASLAAGRTDDEEARNRLVRLVDAVRMHNRREEELMRDVFPTLDAWGPIRSQVMQEEHVLEHQELFASLLGVSTSDSKTAPAAIAVLDKLVAHMDREEKVFLGEDVLSDENINPDYFGG